MFALYVIFLLVISTVLGLAIYHDPGYIMLAYDKWTIEMPLWLAIISLVIFALSIITIKSILTFIKKIFTTMRSWFTDLKHKQARNKTNQGLLALASGNWYQAEKNAIKGVFYSDYPLINYLSAAEAAQEQGANDRRDQYLRLASNVTGNNEIVVGLTQAKLQFKQGQHEQSLATLQQLDKLEPKNILVLQLLAKVYLALKEWKKLLILLPKAAKLKIFAIDEVTKFAIIAHSALLKNDADHWSHIPHNLQIAPELIRLYGLIELDEPDKQLATAEKWLKSHQNDAALLLTLGRLACKNSLWGKAMSYFKSSLDITKKPEVYAELAKLALKLGDKNASDNYYRQGLELSLDN